MRTQNTWTYIENCGERKQLHQKQAFSCYFVLYFTLESVGVMETDPSLVLPDKHYIGKGLAHAPIDN
uniref:Uncharacterized protein n=1 Tax=Anguilla anguilla TaxID=7936 RepID=A0A0E9TI20_ANGAN